MLTSAVSIVLAVAAGAALASAVFLVRSALRGPPHRPTGPPSDAAPAARAVGASQAAGRNCTHRHDGQQPRLVPQPRPSADGDASVGPSTVRGAVSSAGAEEGETFPAARDALFDPETGLSTRAALVQELRRRLAERRRVGGRLGLLLMELTDLAHEPQGPAAAGQHLRSLAATLLKTHTREMDLAARYGAARFAVLLPGASTQESLGVARRLRAGLVVYDDVRVRLLPRRCRWTGGVAVAQDDDDAASLLRRAETALRSAAIAGRDQVYVHDGLSCAPAPEPAAALA